MSKVASKEKGDSGKRCAKIIRKTECPYLIIFFKLKGENLFHLLYPKNENELCHKHLIGELNLLLTIKERKSSLEADGKRRLALVFSKTR